MKKAILLFFALVLGMGLKAQTNLTQAVDFTATDIHGTEVNLFSLLDGGQYVLIDFFFANCGPCQQATPKIVESYSLFGCNMHDVYYIEISDRDNETVCTNWVNNYGVEYPTICGPAGGNTITNQYHINAWPTVILIAPDHSIVIQDLYPIPNTQAVVTALENKGVTQHDCTPPVSYDPQVSISVDLVTEDEVDVTFTPNADCATYYYTLATEFEIQQWVGSTGLSIAEYLQSYGFPGDDVIQHSFTQLTPNTEYGIYAVPEDPDGNLHEVVQELVTTTSSTGGDTIVNFSGVTLDGDTLHLYDILDGGQAVLINFFLTDDPYSMSPMPYLTESYELFGCNQNDVFFMEITPLGNNNACQNWVESYNVKYPTISREGGGNGIAQAIPVGFYPTVMIIRPDHTISYRDLYPLESTQTIVDALESEGYEQHDCNTGVTEETKTLCVYPNPANENVILKGENLGLVRIYNALGQEVDVFEAHATEVSINTACYEDGIYLIKVNDQTMRLVVKH